MHNSISLVEMGMRTLLVGDERPDDGVATISDDHNYDESSTDLKEQTTTKMAKKISWADGVRNGRKPTDVVKTKEIMNERMSFEGAHSNKTIQ